MNYKSKEWFILLVSLVGSLKVITSSFGLHISDDVWDAILNIIGVLVTLIGIVYKTDAYHRLRDLFTKKKQP